MSKSARNVKQNGQAFFRKQAEKVEQVLLYTATCGANVQFGEKPYMRMTVYGTGVNVSSRKHRKVVA